MQLARRRFLCLPILEQIVELYVLFRITSEYIWAWHFLFCGMFSPSLYLKGPPRKGSCVKGLVVSPWHYWEVKGGV
jgi:hypothetical protein